MNQTKLLEQLVDDEDLRLFVYDDATGKPIRRGDTLEGNPTIGIGRELSRSGISRAEAFMLCSNDIVRIESALAQAVPRWHALTCARQRVLANMAFNLGLAGLVGFKRMLSHLNAGDFDLAADEMLRSLWARQVPARAARLAQMMRTGRDL